MTTQLSSNEIRQRFIKFFEKRDHKFLESAPLIPESDGGDRNVTLFNVAGMQPLMPYLLGEDHPEGKRLVNSQKCLRTNDIDEVGDNTHATFFEMLGNWSLGDPSSPDGIGQGGYFKEEAIKYSYDFLIDPDEGLGLDINRLYITIFAGNEQVPKDIESKEIWIDLGVPEHCIYERDSKDNWWTAGSNSPAGPSTEMFYDMTGELGDMTQQEFEGADERQDVVEIWNNVFMSYQQEPRTILVDAVHCLIDKEGAINEELNTYLQRLPNDIIVVTNAPKEKHQKLFENVSFPIFTLEGQPKKEDSEYFKKLLEDYKLVPEDVIYFDHTDENIESAAQENIHGAIYDTNENAIEFIKKYSIKIKELAHKNVDTGSGLERISAVVQGKRSIFETDLFTPVVDRISEFVELNTEEKKKSARIITDHLKSANFLVAEGLEPSNTGRGYILRRLIRRAVTHAYRLGIHDKPMKLGVLIAEIYGDAYSYLINDQEHISEVIQKEEKAFLNTLEKGMKEFEKGERDAFTLFTTFGFPLEMTQELAIEKGEVIDITEFEKKMKEHQEKSRSSAAGQFKGGLADVDDPKVVQLHTAHHLLLSALQQVLGGEVKQRGSNVTSDRLRIDFTFDRKLTDEEKIEVERIVNEKINEGLPVVMKKMPRYEAESLDAQMEFGQKYPDEVSVYFIGDNDQPFSLEFCGGPHVENTSELGTFKIKKEQSSSKGVRRIKAVLQ